MSWVRKQLKAGRFPGCQCQRKAAFDRMIDGQIGNLSVKAKREICRRVRSGEEPAAIMKQYKLKHPAVIHALLFRDKLGRYAPKQRSASTTRQAVGVDTLTASPAPLVHATPQTIIVHGDYIVNQTKPTLLNEDIKTRLRKNIIEMNGEPYISFGNMPHGVKTPELAQELREMGILGERLKLLGNWSEVLN